jgi:hypothetical protein
MHKQISVTIFYSLLFAMGGAPTIAMLIIKAQKVDPSFVYQAFIGLTVIIACILVPLILIQNAYLIYKRNSVEIDQKIKPLGNIYLALNVCCLVFWLVIQYLA